MASSFIESEYQILWKTSILTTRPAALDIETPSKGLEQIREQITNFNPTVVFVGYGMASSFDGEAGLKKFTREMDQLLDSIEQICGKDKLRFVFLSPIPHEKLPSPLPD